LALLITATFHFHNQASQQISDRIFLAAAKKSSINLDAGSIGDQDLIIRAIAVANCKRVSVAVDDDAPEF